MNIYIGNLSYTVEESELRKLMEEYGPVTSAKLIIDRNSGRSKGFAFIEMENTADGEKAIQTLNGNTYKDRPLVVKEAIPRD